MPPKNKKKSKQKAKEDPGNEKHPSSDPTYLFAIYTQFCKKIGLEPNDNVKKSLLDSENNPNYGKQILIDGNDCYFGPGACRALATALLGRVGDKENPESMNQEEPIIYCALQELCIWSGSLHDEGTMAIAELLRLGGAELQLNHLELINCDVQINGATAIGRSLSCGMNQSLLSLNLDFNVSIGVDGIKSLCKGLRTNSTLKKMSLRHCNIVGKAGGTSLGEMLSFSKLSLAKLDLTGNGLGGSGFSAMYYSGLNQNRSLHELNISDINLTSKDDDLEGLENLANLLILHPKLNDINLLFNPITTVGAKILIPALSKNKKISSFKVDTTLPEEIYVALFRNGNKSTKKKRKKTRKKKK